MNTASEDHDDVLREACRGVAPAGSHPDEDAWLAFAGDHLPTDARAALADHVVTCDSCAEIYRAVRTLREDAVAGGYLAAFAPASAPASRRLPRAIWLPLAAAAVLVVAVVAPRLRDAAEPAPDVPVIEAPAQAAPPAAPATPAARAWARDVAAPPVELPARYALVVRGSTNQFVAAFGSAITPYREGRYADAVAQLAPVASAYPDVAEAAFYLGMSQLLSGDAAAARTSLAKAVTAESLGSAARWFGAVAAERSGDSTSADAVLRAICAARAAPGRYQKDACAVVARP